MRGGSSKEVLPQGFTSVRELDAADVRGRSILGFVFGGGDGPVDVTSMHPAWVGGRRASAATATAKQQRRSSSGPIADAEMLALAHANDHFTPGQRAAMRRAFELVDVFSCGKITGEEFATALLTMGINPDVGVGGCEIVDSMKYTFEQFIGAAASSLYSTLRTEATSEMERAMMALEAEEDAAAAAY